MMKRIKRLFSRAYEEAEQESISNELRMIRETVGAAGAKITQSILTINGEEEPRYLCFTKDEESCDASNLDQ